MDRYEDLAATYIGEVNKAKKSLPDRAAELLVEIEREYNLTEDSKYQDRFVHLIEGEGYENYEGLFFMAVNYVQLKIHEANFVPDWMQTGD